MNFARCDKFVKSCRNFSCRC